MASSQPQDDKTTALQSDLAHFFDTETAHNLAIPADSQSLRVSGDVVEFLADKEVRRVQVHL